MQFNQTVGLLSDEWTDALLDDAICGKIRVVMWGKSVRFKLNDRQCAELESAKLSGFINKRTTSDPVQSVYWTWSTIHKRPVVTISPRRLYADIDCDMITAAPYRLDATAMNAINALRIDDRRETYVDADVCCAFVNRIPIAQSEQVARDVFAIAMNFIERTTSAR